jgi:hypothetical protein
MSSATVDPALAPGSVISAVPVAMTTARPAARLLLSMAVTTEDTEALAALEATVVREATVVVQEVITRAAMARSHLAGRLDRDERGSVKHN